MEFDVIISWSEPLTTTVAPSGRFVKFVHFKPFFYSRTYDNANFYFINVIFMRSILFE